MALDRTGDCRESFLEVTALDHCAHQQYSSADPPIGWLLASPSRNADRKEYGLVPELPFAQYRAPPSLKPT
jgi:hypothetical protein